MTEIINPIKVKCPDLVNALWPLAEGDRWAEGTLVDLWKQGFPDPVPDIKDQRDMLEYLAEMDNYDPRRDRWNYHWVLPSKLTEWITEVSERKGIGLTFAQAIGILQGTVILV
jgi:hypothetical protein